MPAGRGGASRIRHDHLQRTAQREQIPDSTSFSHPREENAQPPDQKIDPELLHQLRKRGITEATCVALLRDLRPEQEVLDQLEWGDYLLRHGPPGKFYNPAGLYIHLIRENAIPPEAFESSRQRQLREQAYQACRQQEQELAKLELAYLDYKRRRLEDFISSHYTADQLAALVCAKRQQMLKQDRWRRLFSFRQDTVDVAAQRQVRADIATHIQFITFPQYRQQWLEDQTSSPDLALDATVPGDLPPSPLACPAPKPALP
jgi:hypothetical protein